MNRALKYFLLYLVLVSVMGYVVFKYSHIGDNDQDKNNNRIIKNGDFLEIYDQNGSMHKLSIQNISNLSSTLLIHDKTGKPFRMRYNEASGKYEKEAN